MCDGTTEEGQNAIAQHYGVLDQLNALNHEGDFFDKYYKLLLPVKTESKSNNAWISFVEGLHRHAAILACLLCSKFDHYNNVLEPGLLSISSFKQAQVPHFKKPDLTPRQQLNKIDKNHDNTPMITTHIIIQVYIPKTID